ncbi:MAG: type 4a pilus biogenesis protein PilO [Bryobacteraceae bacterium]
MGERLTGSLRRWFRDPRRTSRIVLGVLLAANLAAAAALLRPWSGSEEQLSRQAAQLRQQLRTQRETTERLRSLAASVEKTRELSQQFLERYFLDRQTAYSTVLSELNRLAEQSGIKPGEHFYTFDPVEGSDEFAMMTINGNYQGSYADLIEFINAIDRSPRFLTIERLQAQPTQTPGVLAIGLRLNVFVRGEAQAQ